MPFGLAASNSRNGSLRPMRAKWVTLNAMPGRSCLRLGRAANGAGRRACTKRGAALPEASTGPPVLPAGSPVRLDAGGLARAVAVPGNAPGRIDARHGCWAATAGDANGITSGFLRIVRGFNAAGPDWCIAVRPVPAMNGAHGQPTGPYAFAFVPASAFVQLGRDRWGWIEKHSDLAQGTVEGVHTIHTLRGPAFIEAGLLPGERSNRGACDDPENPVALPSCTTIESIDVTAAPDASRPDAAAYPILLHATGSVFQAGKGSRRIDKHAVAQFDEARFEYVAPGAWP